MACRRAFLAAEWPVEGLYLLLDRPYKVLPITTPVLAVSLFDLDAV